MIVLESFKGKAISKKASELLNLFINSDFVSLHLHYNKKDHCDDVDIDGDTLEEIQNILRENIVIGKVEDENR